MNILNSKETLVKDQFSYFKINSIGSVTGYDAINLPDGMTIYKPDGYIYGTPTKQQTKSSVFLAKSRDENIYKIVELQVIDTNEIPFSIPDTLNDSLLKITGIVSPSGKSINLNLNNTLSGYYKNSDNFLNSTISGVPIYSTITQYVNNPLNFYGASLLSCNSIPLLNANLYNISGVTIGANHTLAILSGISGGVITGWGNNDDGQISGGKNCTGIIEISAGSGYSLALKKDGTITGWGKNNYNQALGAGNIKAIELSAGNSHSLGLIGAGGGGGSIGGGACGCIGTITGWGNNSNNQALGGNGLTGVISIVAADNYSLALFADGRVTGWGDNSYNQAQGGNNLTGIIKISADGHNSVALTNDGRVINWGIWASTTGQVSYITGLYSATGSNSNPITIPTAPGVVPPANTPNPILCSSIILNCNDNNKYQIITGYDAINCPMYGCAPCPPMPTCPYNIDITGYDEFGCKQYACSPCESEIPVIDETNSSAFITCDGAGTITIDFFPKDNWAPPISQLIWGDLPANLIPATELPTNLYGTKSTWTISHTYSSFTAKLTSSNRTIIDYNPVNGCPIYASNYNYKVDIANLTNATLSNFFPTELVESGDQVIFEIAGNIGGSYYSNAPSLDTGSWPAGVILRLIVPSVKGAGCNPYEGIVAGRGGGFCGSGNPYGGASVAILIRNGVNLVIENHGIIGGGGRPGRDDGCCCGEGGGGAGIPGGRNNGGGGNTCCGGETPGQTLCGGTGSGGGGNGGGLNTGAPAVALEGNGTYSFAPESTRPYFG